MAARRSPLDWASAISFWMLKRYVTNRDNIRFDSDSRSFARLILSSPTKMDFLSDSQTAGGMCRLCRRPESGLTP